MQNQQQETISSPSKVSHRLTQGMDPEERKSFEGSYMRAKKVLKKLNEYASKQATVAELQLDNPKNFEVANWQHLMAWQGGYRTAMRRMEEMTRT